MKRIMVAAIALILILIFFFVKHKKTANLVLAMVKDSPLDLGEVKVGSPVHGVFKIFNLGKSVIQIERVSTDCHCSHMTLSNQVLQPNDSANVTLFYDSTQIGLFQSIGMVYLAQRPDPVIMILRGNVIK